MSSSTVEPPIAQERRSTIPGSMDPERVAIIRPSSGV